MGYSNGLEMRFLKKLLAPKEVRAALGVLDEASCTFDSHHGYLSNAFQMVRDPIEKMILDHPSEFVRAIQKGTSPRQWVYNSIAKDAGDLLETGEYHIRRGFLNPIGPGEDLLRLFNAALDELVRIEVMEPDFAENEKRVMLKIIREAG